jgi:hypothetical protein
MDSQSNEETPFGSIFGEGSLTKELPSSKSLPSNVMQDKLEHFDQLCKWRSHETANYTYLLDIISDFETGATCAPCSSAVSDLPKGSPYVGSHRHAPPSPLLTFSRQSSPMYTFPPLLEMPESALQAEQEGVTPASLGSLPEEVWTAVLNMVVDTPGIARLAPVSRPVLGVLKSEMVWIDRCVRIPPSGMAKIAPRLSSWLKAWKFVKKLVIPRSAQLIKRISEQAPKPDFPVEISWRFDKSMKGDGVEVINHGRSVRRRDGAVEELVVLGDAPLVRTDTSQYFEVTLDDRSAENDEDSLNDFGIGVTVRSPSSSNELGSVAGEVPFSWVVDFTATSVVLSVNNQEAAKAMNVSGEDLKAGDRVGLKVTAAGTLEIFLNGELREHLEPDVSERVPQGMDLFPVIDLYGCTVQISRSDAECP